MKRTTRNFVTDLVLFVQVSSLVLTGILLKFVLPPGSGGRHQAAGWSGMTWPGGCGYGDTAACWGPRTFLGKTRHEWGDVHLWISVSLVCALVLHLMLHLRWIVCRFKDLWSGRSASGRGCEVPEETTLTKELR
jgi:hypothetical protein